jgi:hypothetical protein
MSGDASIELDWAGDQRRFRLAIGQLRELQESINRPRAAIGAPTIGPRSLLRMLGDGDAWPDEVREIIRLGLIGGGTPIGEVPALVRRYVDERPLLESAPVAQAILLTALVGPASDQIAQKKTKRTASQATSSSSLSSTERDAQLDSRPEKSTSSRSGNSSPASKGSNEPIPARANPSL